MNERSQKLVKLGHSLGIKWAKTIATKGELSRLARLKADLDREATAKWDWNKWFAYEDQQETIGERLFSVIHLIDDDFTAPGRFWYGLSDQSDPEDADFVQAFAHGALGIALPTAKKPKRKKVAA